VCVVTDRRRWPRLDRDAIGQRLDALVIASVAAKVALMHIRERDMEAGALYDLVRRLACHTRGTATALVVNERADVAMAGGGAGVHLRGSSAPSARVRAVAPPGFLVGRSVHSVEEALAAEEAGVDYVCFGTVFASRSKGPAHCVAGLAALRAVTAACTVPVLGIGGMSLDSIAQVADAGAAGIAAVDMFSGGDDSEQFEPGRAIGEALDAASRCKWR
jgi:thiamine-phosphate diphosphorylase